jgi:hypothetical protein
MAALFRLIGGAVRFSSALPCRRRSIELAMHDSEDRDNPTARPGITWLLLVAVVFPAIVAYGILYRQASLFRTRTITRRF